MPPVEMKTLQQFSGRLLTDLFQPLSCNSNNA